jgi:long-chain acyl-CoA synthetase
MGQGPDPEAIAAAATTGTTMSLHAQAGPQRAALISPHGNRTYAELDANANRLAHALRAAGLRPGDAVALVCRNRPEFAEVYSACLRSGLRVTPVNWHLTAEEMGYIIADCDALAVIADAAFAAAAAEALSANPVPKVRLAIGGTIDGFDDYAAITQHHPSTPLTEPALGRTMLYTSGTTGRPKGVERYGTPRPASDSPLYQRMIATAAMTPDDTHLCTGPLYHAAPLAFSLGVPLMFGMTVVLMDGWEAEQMLRLVDSHHVTHTHVVPTMFHRLLALPADVRSSYDVSSLRFVMHGAAPCPIEVKRATIEWLGPVVYEYYAATEGGGTFVTSEEWLERPGTVGRPVEQGTVRIYDDAGADLGPGAIGTVYLRPAVPGPFRYYKDEAKTAASYRGDYFTVGDHGYFDDDGYLFLTGRIAELIISGGVNIYPAEVDAVLLEHPAVADAGTIGIPNDEWGEEVKAIVELRPGRQATPELHDELLDWCRDRLARYKCPRSVAFVDQLPRHDNGKLYRRRLREQFVDTSLSLDR